MDRIFIKKPLKTQSLKLKARDGNILIESIVSVSLILIGLLGVFNLITSSVRQNKDVNLRAAASYLAVEGIEVMKNIVDTDVVSAELPWTNTVGGSSYEVEYDSDNNPESAPVDLGEGSTSTTRLVIDNNTGLYRYSIPGNEGNETTTPFTRTVTVSINEENSDELIVTSVVGWLERGEYRQVNLQTIFANWRTD